MLFGAEPRRRRGARSCATRRAASTSSRAGSSSSRPGSPPSPARRGWSPTSGSTSTAPRAGSRSDIPFNIPPDRPTPRLRRSPAATRRSRPAIETLEFPTADPYAVEAERVRRRRPRRRRRRRSRPRTRREPAGHRARCSRPRDVPRTAVDDGGYHRGAPGRGRRATRREHRHEPSSREGPPTGPRGRGRRTAGRACSARIVVVAVIGGARSRSRRPWVPSEPACPPRGRAPRVVRRPALGRGAARRDPPRAARTRRSTPATCSTPRSRCGTRGRPTTRPRRGYLVTEKHTAGDVDGGPQRGDQLRGLPGPQRALHQGRRRRGVAVRVRRRDGHAVLPARRHDDRGRLARRRSATGSRPPSSPTA